MQLRNLSKIPKTRPFSPRWHMIPTWLQYSLKFRDWRKIFHFRKYNRNHPESSLPPWMIMWLISKKPSVFKSSSCASITDLWLLNKFKHHPSIILTFTAFIPQREDFRCVIALVIIGNGKNFNLIFIRTRRFYLHWTESGMYHISQTWFSWETWDISKKIQTCIPQIKLDLTLYYFH